jgi:hypothetical protein
MVLRMAAAHGATRATIASPPYTPWRQALSGYNLFAKDRTDGATPSAEDEARTHLESLIRDANIVVSSPQMASELAVLDGSGSALVAGAIAVARLSLSREFVANVRHEVLDYDPGDDDDDEEYAEVGLY